MCGMLAAWFTRCRSAHGPPVIVTSVSPSGRSRPLDGATGRAVASLGSASALPVVVTGCEVIGIIP